MIGSYSSKAIGETKTWNAERACWIRQSDSEIAERYFGYQWLPCSPHTDFGGNTFHVVLTLPPLDGHSILEPDTRVPNYSTNLQDALSLARTLGWDSVPLRQTDRDMAAAICARALSTG